MMKKLKLLLAAAAVLTPLAVASSAPADTPFPTTQAGDVFVVAQTVDTNRAMTNQFAPGATVVFRAWALDGKTHRTLGPKAVKYFYVKIPNQPSVKLHYTPKSAAATGRFVWTGSWAVPADYPTGPVFFKVLIKTKKNRVGSFVQMPVPTARLTITTHPQAPPAAGPTTKPPAGSATSSVALYVDSVNGSRPPGARPRNVGCTQTNVFKRGEQVVIRTWGYDLTTGAALTMENVTDAHYSIPGQKDIPLNWGSHGAAKVWFWSNFWNIPAGYPLGDVTVRVSFTTDTGKTGTFNHELTIIP
jgi:hypothetical protein